MRVLAIVFVALSSPLFAESEESAVALKRLSELEKLSASIVKDTTEEEVISILGEPLAKGTGGVGWSHPNRRWWNYLNYTDDSVHRSFNVFFDPKTGCSVSKVEVLRSEIEKEPLIVDQGEVLQVYPFDPKKNEEGFLCHVRFTKNGRDFTIMIGVERLDRVEGIPKVGSAVRMKHRSKKFDFVFKGGTALYLESIVFTPKGEDAGDQ